LLPNQELNESSFSKYNRQFAMFGRRCIGCPHPINVASQINSKHAKSGNNPANALQDQSVTVCLKHWPSLPLKMERSALPVGKPVTGFRYPKNKRRPVLKGL
jgi:hypothetical protein